jgi:uncharacterized protein YbcC (UPF0753/DUF2309 family)
MNHLHTEAANPRELLRQALVHIEHVLPGQGPLLEFVHHNTIHGLQHLPFLDALAEYEALTGIRGFQTDAVSRDYYRKGRITDDDLDAVFAAHPHLDAMAVLCETQDGRRITRKSLYRCALLHELPELGVAQVQWQLEHGALERCQSGVTNVAAAALREGHATQVAALHVLWQALLQKLGAVSFAHAEDYSSPLDAMPERDAPIVLPAALKRALQAEVEHTFAKVGDTWTLRQLLLQLRGIDLLDTVRPQLIRLGGSLLDEGLASWHLTDAQAPSLYAAWRRLCASDPQLALLELDQAGAFLRSLPDDAWDAIAVLLRQLGIAEGRWASYLERLALELPGWAGLIAWRQQHPRHRGAHVAEPRLEDFLAVRLCLDKLLLDKHCGELWHCAGSYDALLAHFWLNPAELQVSLLLQAGALPEHLSRAVETLLIQADAKLPGHTGWDRLALRVQEWRSATGVEIGATLSHGRLWRLFCLCQHLGLAADDVKRLDPTALHTLLKVFDGFTASQRGHVWLCALERHYRDKVFAALAANRQRGGWLRRRQRAEAQIVLCMDEREESLRRYIEELNPRIETLGVAGFFGVPMQYRGLDDTVGKPMCPIVVTPTHKVDEVARAGHEERLRRHQGGGRRLRNLTDLLHQQLRIRPLLAAVVTLLSAPVMLVAVLIDSLLPDWRTRIGTAARAAIAPPVATELRLTALSHDDRDADGLQRGFTVQEQSIRVAGLLRAMGLTSGFAPIVAFAGHGSTTTNNPYAAAYDCGACGGRKGGANARAFAAMANHPQVRAALARQFSIAIPADCWFVGLQHDTCSDALTWYDTDLIPSALRQRFEKFQGDLAQARQLAARERCRRFASARHPHTAVAAFRHVTRRAQDPAQVRPEYGHATNAAAVIGRRQLTQGVFLDRRVFLISYDPTQDPDGKIVENILLTAGPVGAGISLEYYFSTIDNERFGCGTKAPHNVTALCAVMEGASSDLRTGLPLQTVEIHEAMRLQVIVEAPVRVLARIYGEQPALQELVGGGWVLLSAVDPDTGAISVFEPERGFVPWHGAADAPGMRDDSAACYGSLSTPVAPLLIRPPQLGEARA